MRYRTRERVESAIEQAQGFLLDRFLPHGRFPGGCEARALESALALHVLRVLGTHPAEQQRLACYCQAFLDTGRTHPRSRAEGFDTLLSSIMCRAVLGMPQSNLEVTALNRVVEAFAHPTQQRKRVFVEVLLADLGVRRPEAQVLGREHVHDETCHAWVRMLLTGLRIVEAHHLGRATDIDVDEIRFLEQCQGPTGGWEQHVLGTLVVTLALAYHGQSDAAVHRGLAFVLATMRESGGVPFIPDQDIWVTSLSGFVLLESGDLAIELESVARYVREQQLDGGGWGFSEGVTQADSDDTSFGLMFLARQDRQCNRTAIRRAVRYLAGLQNTDGGFPTFVRGAPSEIEITAKVLRAMGELGRSQESIVYRAWFWLLAQQAPGGGFSCQWNLCHTFPHLHVLEAVASCGHLGPMAVRGILRRRCVDYLLRHRKDDGGWSVHPSDHRSHSLATAYAMAALGCSGVILAPDEVARSAEQILGCQRADGGFDGPADSLGPRPFVYNVPILATIYSLWALVRIQQMLRGSTEPHAGIYAHERIVALGPGAGSLLFPEGLLDPDPQ